MELSKRLDMLLGMKERANGAYCRAHYCYTVISIVNAQTESETGAPATSASQRDDVSDSEDDVPLSTDMPKRPAV